MRTVGSHPYRSASLGVFPKWVIVPCVLKGITEAVFVVGAKKIGLGGSRDK